MGSRWLESPMQSELSLGALQAKARSDWGRLGLRLSLSFLCSLVLLLLFCSVHRRFCGWLSKRAERRSGGGLVRRTAGRLRLQRSVPRSLAGRSDPPLTLCQRKIALVSIGCNALCSALRCSARLSDGRLRPGEHWELCAAAANRDQGDSTETTHTDDTQALHSDPRTEN